MRQTKHFCTVCLGDHNLILDCAIINRDASHKAACPCGHWLGGTSNPLMCCHACCPTAGCIGESRHFSSTQVFYTSCTAFLYQLVGHFLDNPDEN